MLHTGSCYAVERWQKQWSQIKETVRRVLTSFNLVDAEKHVGTWAISVHIHEHAIGRITAQGGSS